MKRLLLSGLLLLGSITVASAQGVGINNDGSPANSSAILDVKSTTQGMLIPRMTEAQRNLIATPATGLLVYQTDMTAGFYFYNGTAWTSLNGGGGSPTGAAGGDLGGTYPNPTIASLPAISGANLTNLTAANLTGTVAAAQMPAFTGDITTSAGSTATTIANNAVTSAKIADGAIVNADINASAAIAGSKIDASSLTSIPAGNLTGTLPAISGANLTNLPAGNLTGTVAIANGGTGQTTANAALNALLPSQTGNSGKYLTTDGANASWDTPAGGGGGTYTQILTNTVSVTLGTTVGDIASPAFSVSANKTAIVSIAVTGTNSNLGRSFYITDGSDNVLGSVFTTSANQGTVVTVMAIINNSTGSAVNYKLRGICNTASSVTITNYAVRKIEF